MRELAIVLGLIKQGNKYLLQLRSGDPKIGAANLIGCFGGKIESGESSVDAVCRELSEETNLMLTAEDVQYIGQVEVVSDHQLETVQVTADVFMVKVDLGLVEAREGELIKLTADDAHIMLSKMTPGTRAVFEQLVPTKER